jgi:uncharacterized membrane protein YkvA (DUF1232 family)
MSEKKHPIINQDKGFFQDVVFRIKLILRLMGDRRVNFFLKLLPVGALIYLVSPIDLLPGAVIPVIGALDDAAVIWIGANLFISLCPDDVVQEHTNSLKKVVTATWRDAPQGKDTGEIVDIEPHKESKTE